MSNVTYATHFTQDLDTKNIGGVTTVSTQVDSQATVRMDKILKQSIEEYLSTEDARKKGYKSLAQFVNKGSRDLLNKESQPQEKPTHFILPNLKDHNMTLDLDIYTDKVYCNMCESDHCVHVKVFDEDKDVKKYRKKYNLG